MLIVLATLSCHAEGHRAASQATDVAAPSRFPAASIEEGPYPVAHISDGDTIMIRKDGKVLTVRLIGVDAPEIEGPYRHAEPFGDESRRYIVGLLDGQNVSLQGDAAQPPRDQYGRMLAYVYRSSDHKLINEEMIRSGYASAYRRFKFSHHADFIDAEQQARAAHRGMWRSQ